MHFDLCIKNYGLPTVSRSSLKIDIIESTPYEQHKKDVKVFELVSRAAQLRSGHLDELEVLRRKKGVDDEQ